LNGSNEPGKVRLGLDIAKKVADDLGVALNEMFAEAEAAGSKPVAGRKRK
jgi:hypothetical protein